MRILFIDTTTDSPEIGGGHLILPAIMNQLFKRGHEVHLVTKGRTNSKLRQLIEMSGAVLHVSPWRKKAPVSDLAPIFADWINSIKPDVYVISNSAAIGWVVLPLLPPDLPRFVIGHNNEQTYYYPAEHYSHFITGAIGVSEEICNGYIEKSGIQSTDVYCIPYGVEASKVSPNLFSNNKLSVVYVGRIEEGQKRISDLIRIIKEIYAQSSNFQFTIIGDGPQMKFLRTELREYIKSGVVVIRGWLDKKAIYEQLLISEVFIMTSAFEGFSIALVEAMANGCCPVVSDIKAGNKQLIINGDNGFLVRVGDIQSYVNVLRILSNDKAYLNKLRHAAWNTGSNYSMERMGLAYEQVFIKGIENAVISIKRKHDKSYPLMNTCVSRYPIWLRRLKAKLIRGHQV